MSGYRQLHTHMRRNAKSQEFARKRIIQKRGNFCEKCNYPSYVELHHIERVIDGGKFEDDNLILLCEKCHADAHGITKKKYLDPKRLTWKSV